MEIMVTDRRRAERTSTALDALVAIEESRHAFDCAIRDMNEYGARIDVGSTEVPELFYLIDVLSSIAYRARRVWRKDRQAGVRFLEVLLLKSDVCPAWLVEAQRARLAADAVARSSPPSHAWGRERL